MLYNIFNNSIYPRVILGASISILTISPQIVLSIPAYEIKQIAKEITVLIFTPAGSGSGVIIAKNNDNYWVLTAGHVIEGIKSQESADIQTYDGKSYLIDTSNIILFNDLDLGLVKFTAPEINYQVAAINNSEKVEELTEIFVAGYPLPGQAMRRTFNITTGNITSIDTFNNAGYDLVYTNATRSGMSGGPILNNQGELIGIHGRAEGTLLPDGTAIKAGFNLGIPIQAFIQELPRTEIDEKLDLKIASSTSTNSPTPNPSHFNASDSFKNFIEPHYEVVSTLVQARDVTSLYSYLPINKERFNYQNKEGETQNYQTTMIKTTESFSQSVARGEIWKVSHHINDINMVDNSHAIVYFEQIVHWSYWPGLINGVAIKKLREDWELINDKWQIISAQEVK